MNQYLGDPVFWVLASIGIVLTGISKSGFAGGAGVVAVPLLALLMPVPTAAALMLPLLLVMDARTVLYYRRSVDVAALKQIVPAALLGIAIAGAGFGLLPSSGLQIALGVFSVLFAIWHKLAAVLGGMPGGAALWGGLSGISSTLLHAGGPPINIYLITRQLPKEIWLGTAAVFFAVMNLVKIVPYTMNKQWSQDLLLLSAVFLPLALAGIWAGKRIQTRISEAQFMTICRSLLLVSGLLLLAKSFLA